MLKLRKNKKGFTLVELIVVIAIMAVLAGTVAGVTVSQLNKSKNDSAASDIKNLLNEFETFIAGSTELVAKINVETTANDGLEPAKELVKAFNDEKVASKGLGASYELLTYTAPGTDGKLQAAGSKSGANKYAYNITYAPATAETTVDGKVVPAQPAKLTLTIWCDKIGSTGANPTGTRTYEI